MGTASILVVKVQGYYYIDIRYLLIILQKYYFVIVPSLQVENLLDLEDRIMFVIIMLFYYVGLEIICGALIMC